MSYNPSRSVSTVCNIEIYHFKEFMENNEMILTGSRGNFRKRCLGKNSGFYMVSMLCRRTKEFTRWNMIVRSSVGCTAQLVFRKHGFETRRSLNFSRSFLGNFFRCIFCIFCYLASSTRQKIIYFIYTRVMYASVLRLSPTAGCTCRGNCCTSSIVAAE